MYLIFTSIFFLFQFIYVSSNKNHNMYLSKMNQNKISSIIQNKRTSVTLRNKINVIMYVYYEHWAVHKAYCFKRLHKYKCMSIPVEEFILSSKLGLYQACKKYNGQTQFSVYASTYIMGELYRALTDLHVLTNVSKFERKKSKTNFTVDEKLQYKRKLKSTLFSKTEEFIIDKFGELSETPDDKTENTHAYIELWYQINNVLSTMDTFTKLCFYYKLDEQFNIKRTNKQISELFGCSEEYVRKKFSRAKKIIGEKIIGEKIMYEK